MYQIIVYWREGEGPKDIPDPDGNHINQDRGKALDAARFMSTYPQVRYAEVRHPQFGVIGKWSNGERIPS